MRAAVPDPTNGQIPIWNSTLGQWVPGANGGGGYTPPTGTGFAHVTGGAQDAASIGETGSGNVVRANSPTIVTPTIASLANANHTHQNAAGGGTLDGAAIAAGTIAKARGGTGADNSSVTFPASGTIPVTTDFDTADKLATLLGAGDFSGSGAFARATSPTFVTPTLGAASATSLAASGDVSAGSFTTTGTLTIGSINFGTTMTTDDTYAGIVRSGFNNSGGVTQWDAVYLNSSSQWVLADANGSGTYPAQGIAVATVATANATTVITRGTIRNDAWNWTIGGLIYLSTTAGGLTQTPPGTIGDKIQVMGYALNADTMAVQISPTYETVGDKYFEFCLSDETTAITTGTAKVTWRAPFAFTVKDLRASLSTVSSSGVPTVDINEGGTTIISTKLTIDASEKTSTTAATPYVLSDSAIADDAEITFDIDVAGTGAAGLKVKIFYTKP